MTGVCAVIVSFRPEPDALIRAIEACAAQVQRVVLVDNGSPEELLAPVTKTVESVGGVLIALRTNEGLAAAQNRGIEYARNNRFEHVILFDQDSVVGDGMVAALVREVRALESSGRRVAAVGPVFHDPRDHRPAPFVRVGFPVSSKLWCDGATSVECDFLISSGVLMPLSALDDLGDMDDGLFIDNVDLEWSFRARSRGYSLFGVCGASMVHHLGDDRVAILGTRFTRVRHSPVRLYFIMRNRVALYRLAHTPRVWIAQDVIRIPMKFVIFSVFAGPRLTNIRYMVRGLTDGLRGRRGACPLVTQ